MIRLNLGCADYHRLPREEGWVNVDVVPEHRPDVVCDVAELDRRFDEESVDEIYAGHVLEHLWEPIAVLEHWRSLLKPGGKLGVVIPDAIKIMTDPGLNARQRQLMLLPTWEQHPYSQFRCEGVGLIPPPLGHCQLVAQPVLRLWLERAGYERITPIDIPTDPRLLSHIGWQSGLDASKPEGTR